MGGSRWLPGWFGALMPVRNFAFFQRAFPQASLREAPDTMPCMWGSSIKRQRYQMGKFCWNSTENVSLTKVPPLSMGGKLLQASKLHIWCINSLLNKCRPYITISGSIQPFKMVKIVPENKCPRVPVWVKGGGCDRYLGNAQIDPTFFKLGLPLRSCCTASLQCITMHSAYCYTAS